MNFDDEQLVARIAQQVIQALGQRGIASPVHPPAGQCSVEKSSPEVSSESPLQAPQEEPPAPPLSVLSGIVTAQQLGDAIARQGVAHLAHDARLTPLASDFAREKPDQVLRGTDLSTDARVSGGRWLYWADGHCSAVQSVTASHRDRLLPSGASRTQEGLVQAVRSLSQGVAQGDVVGGLLFVSNAAYAGVLAGACANLRSVVGTGEQSVKQALHTIAPNVLIIEYPHTAAQTLASMVKLMTAQSPRPMPQLMRQLDVLRGLS